MKCTSGPWQIKTHRIEANKSGFNNQQKVGTISTPDGLKICEVFDTALPDMNGANINLLASAPLLLERLKRAVQYFHDNGGHDAYTWLAWMESAIEKAEKG